MSNDLVFKTGDQIICTDATGCDHVLTEKKKYEVLEYLTEGYADDGFFDPAYVRVLADDNKSLIVIASRFILEQ